MGKRASARQVAKSNRLIVETLEHAVEEMDRIINGSNIDSLESRIKALEAEVKSLKALRMPSARFHGGAFMGGSHATSLMEGQCTTCRTESCVPDGYAMWSTCRPCGGLMLWKPAA